MQNKQSQQELIKLSQQNNALKKTITEGIKAELISEDARRFAENIVETIREPLLVLDNELKIISANRNFYKNFRVTSDETIGSFIYDLGNKQWDIPDLRKLLEEVLPEKESFDDYEVDHNFKDIGHKIMLLNARQINRRDIYGKMILLAIEDITERKLLENLLSESEDRYRRLFENASDGIVLLEKQEGRITHANPATEKMLGYTKNECIGNRLQDIGISLDLGDFRTTMQNLNIIGILNYSNVLIEIKSGEHIDTEIYLVDRAKLVQCNIRNITDRTRAEIALRKTEEMYRLVVDNMADVITIIDLNFHFTYVSPSIIRLRGYTPEEVMAQTIEEIMTPESLQSMVRVLEEEMRIEAGGAKDPVRSRILELEEYKKDGSIICIENHLSFMRDKTQNVVAIISLSRDITERRQSQNKLIESEQKYRLLFDSAGDAIFLTDMETKIMAVNLPACERLGYTHAELMSMTMRQVNSPAMILEFPDRITRLREDGYLAFETMHQRKNGSLIPTDVTARQIIWEGQPAIMSICRDISARKRTEEELGQMLDRLKKSFGTIVQVMISAIEARDPYTSGHQKRVTNIGIAIAAEMALPREKIEAISMAGPIHDIGKLSIPSDLLSKPVKLSAIEFALIKEHSLAGYEILKNVDSPWPLAEIVYQHHERMNGSGYPRNLKGDEILIEARIMAVADVVESMASHRPYRAALGINTALEEIEKNKGILYDTTVVDVCLRLFREKGYQLCAV